MSGALLRYRVMAWVTGVFLLALTIWAIVGYAFLGYGDGGAKPAAYSLAWTGHGWFYFIYLITAVDLTFRMRWSILATIGVLVAGTIPGASFVAEHWVTKKVRAQTAGLANPNAATAAPSDQVNRTA
jgi:integral membrane protein